MGSSAGLDGVENHNHSLAGNRTVKMASHVMIYTQSFIMNGKGFLEGFA